MATAITPYPLDKKTGLLFMEMLRLEEVVLMTDNITTILEQCKKVADAAGTLPQTSVNRAMDMYDRL